MPSPWFVQLGSLIGHVFRLPMEAKSDKSPLPDVFSRDVFPVFSFLRWYIGFYETDTEHYDTLSRARIWSVKLMKRSRGLEREYILVRVVDDSRPRATRHLCDIRIERDLRPEDWYTTPNNSAYSASSRSSKRLPENDILSINRPPALTDTTVYEYKFSEANAPYLKDLLVAAAVLHDYSPKYILLTRKSYWFAGMLLRMLLGDVDDPAVTWGASQVQFALAYKGTEGRKFVKAGAREARTFKKLFRIVTGDDVDSLYTEEVQEAYQSKLGEVNKEIEEAHEAEVRRIEEYARKDEELARLAEELARLDEELARLAEERAALAAQCDSQGRSC